MKREEKAERILKQLAALYPEPPIPLDHQDPFTLLVAVVLSAQTTDKKVNEVTPKLFAVAPDAGSMAAMEIEAVRQLIREIGLAPQKAKSLVGLAQGLMTHHGGKVPSDFEALIALPGVGRKTANVVMAQAFGQAAFPVDTHIFRLAHRWGLSKGKNADQVEDDLKPLFPRESWNRLHLQIIYFGREHCPALHHDLSACPICSWAATQTQKDQELANNLALRTRKKVSKKKQEA